MKAIELMYDNWVMVRNISYPVRVKMVTRKKIGYHHINNNTRLFYSQLIDVTPIEITHDILMSNNFDLDDDLYCITLFNGNIYLKYNDKNQIWVFTTDNNDYIQMGFEIKYIHELQQAINLLKLNFNIQL